jgi:long-chain acyl-CoA synthetase
MRRESLLDFFEDYFTRADVYLVHDDGYRTRQASYADVGRAARRFAARLEAAGAGHNSKVVIWSENRVEWIVALWGCLLAGAVIVPVDYRASVDFLKRVSGIVRARVVLVGDEVEHPAGVTGEIWRLTEEQDVAAAAGAGAVRAREDGRPVEGGSLAEIIFTSGATADPKGVTITHRNILANVVPIEREIAKYRKWIWPVHPLRFLNLLPLSHMFGQSMAAFVPPMLAGTAVFSHGYSPVEIVRQIRTRRISVLVCVPKVLDVVRHHVETAVPATAGPDDLAGRHWAWRWWRYRSVHRLFGWKFWCIVCGAAPLDPELEAFWRKLGFLVVQGYGLTETAPIVTLNHPLRASQGTVGRPMVGVDVRIAPDGEILVRGENVTKGYYAPDDESAPDSGTGVFEGGWLHTGDIGAFDESGRLLIRGRKKEMIVTPQGLNVFPEDVERAIATEPGVIEAGVVGVRVGGEERVHAVLVLAPGADVDAIVRGANTRLEDHQRVWSTSIWPGAALPRTEGTQKLKRRELQRWATEGPEAVVPPAGGSRVSEIVGRFASGRSPVATTTLDELGLSSLDRVELMMALEEAFQTTLDEAALAGDRTIADLEGLLGTRSPGGPAPDAAESGTVRHDATARGTPARLTGAENAIAFPSWNRSGPAWLLRRISLPTWILPLGRVFMTMTVDGLGHLHDIAGPVVFAANHQSHMDTPAIMLALPGRWRYHLAPAMAKEFFKAHFNPRSYSRREWFTNSLNYYLSCQFFNAFPLPQREAGTRQTLRYIGDVLGDGYSVLIFPEGKRTETGAIGRFMPGVGMIGAKLHVPVVPVRLEGLDSVLHQKMKFPRRGPVRVAFGPPLRLAGEDYAALARQVEEAVRGL